MRPPWWTTRVGRATILFGATFSALVAAGWVGMRHVHPLTLGRQEVPALIPPDPSWFPVLFRGGVQLDHVILWNGIGRTIENARRADVFFLGSSHIQFALSSRELRQFERRSGVTAFSLALPFGEGYEFPLRLIEKFDLRPRVVVVNLPGFFEATRTPGVGSDVYWTALTTVWEERLAAAVWPSASRVLPSFITNRPAGAMLRSAEDGTWLTVQFPHGHWPVRLRPVPPKWQIRTARQFKDAMAARGTEVVLTCVPSTRDACDPSAVSRFASALGVRALVPRIDAQLWTIDFAHLCPLSGKRFARALLRDLAQLGTIRTIGRARRGVRSSAP